MTTQTKTTHTPHTPGPWTVYRGAQGQISIDQDGEKGKADIAIIPKGANGLGEANDSNARLIAAAPEMLEALRLIARNDIGAWDPREIARAAIAKAEGK